MKGTKPQLKMRQIDLDNLEIVKSHYGMKDSEAVRHALRLNKDGFLTKDTVKQTDYICNESIVGTKKFHLKAMSYAAMSEYMQREDATSAVAIREALEALVQKLSAEELELIWTMDCGDFEIDEILVCEDDGETYYDLLLDLSPYQAFLLVFKVKLVTHYDIYDPFYNGQDEQPN